MFEPWWVLVGLGTVLAAFALVWRPMRTASREARFAQARRDFHYQRERLEAKFVRLASAAAGPNSPHWDDCEFDDDVAYVRNRNTGELSAFVALTVEVDGREGRMTDTGDLIGNLRAGTAVFRFDESRWETDGRAILNLIPSEAILFYQNDFEMIDQELAGQSLARG